MSKNLVIIPTYNEKENIQEIVRRVFALRTPFHVLVVDDGSPDGTAAIVKGLQTEFPNQLHLQERAGKLGLGTAYMHGFRWGLDRGYQYLFEMDADFSHDPNDLERLLAACQTEGYDVAIGSRYVPGGQILNWPKSRKLISYYGSVYARLVSRMKVRDLTAGFMCFSAPVLQRLLKDDIRLTGYGFQVEMKFRAWKYGFRIKEVPITFTDGTLGASKMSGGIVSEALVGIPLLKIHSWTRRWDP